MAIGKCQVSTVTMPGAESIRVGAGLAQMRFFLSRMNPRFALQKIVEEENSLELK